MKSEKEIRARLDIVSQLLENKSPAVDEELRRNRLVIQKALKWVLEED